MRYLYTRRGTSRYRNGNGIDVAVIVWPRRQHSTESRELFVPLTVHIPVAYRKGPAARSVAALRAAVSARPGHHGGALDWVRNGAWASVLAGAAAGRLVARTRR